jgi:serine/threonine protein kinase
MPRDRDPGSDRGFRRCVHCSRFTRLHNAAALRPAADQAAHLSQACGADEALRRDVESLLGQGQSFRATPVALPRGSRLGAYELLSVIGAGGMGVVYRARDTRLQRDVALKLRGDRPRSRSRGALSTRSPDPGVAQSSTHRGHLRSGRIRGHPGAVLELVEGPTLADRSAQGPIPPDGRIFPALTTGRSMEIS